MKVSTLTLVTLFTATVAMNAACTTKRDEPLKSDSFVESTRAAGDKAVDATRSAGERAAEGTREVAGAVADKSKDMASAAGDAVTDSWVTARLKAKFADETLLGGSDIEVNTAEHVVTLKGHVRTTEGRTRAGQIASGTDGVTRVVNELVIVAI